MGLAGAERTSATLLGRLRVQPNDEAAWTEFYRQYWPGLVRFGLRQKLTTADAEEVAQRVLAKMARTLRSFEYDPNRSFRGWLRTVAQRAWLDFLGERWLTEAASPAVAAELNRQEHAASLGQSLEEEYDRELLEIALVRVRQRVEPRTWRVFERLALKGEAVAEVAAAENLSIASAYRARSRFQRLLTSALREMDGE